MIKKIMTKLPIRKISLLLMTFVLLISVSSCKNSNLIGNIDVNETYLTLGDYSVTKGELWEEFRWNTTDLLTAKMEKVLYQKYYDEIVDVVENNTDAEKKEKYLKELEDIAIVNIFALASEDPESLKDVSNTIKKQTLQKFIDNVYVEYNVELDFQEIMDGNYTNTYKYFYKTLAKKLFAKDKLLEAKKEADDEVEDVEDDGFFSTSQILNKYKDEYLNQGDIDLLMVRFINEDEVNTTLRAFGIKTYKTNWYYIKADKPMSYYQYTKYYNDFEINLTDSTQDQYRYNIESRIGEAGILQIYIEIYNYIYTYREQLNNVNLGVNTDTLDRRNVTEAIMNSYDIINTENNKTVDDIYSLISSSEYTHYTSKEISKISSSLKTYVYQTLSVDDSEGTAYNRYTTSGRSYGSYYYLIFKIGQEPDTYDIYEKDISDDDLYEKITGNVGDENYKNTELYNLIIEDLIEDSNNNSYTEKAFSEAIAEMKIKIYDEYLEISYASKNSNYTKNRSKAKDSNYLAEIKYDGEYYYLTADECFEQLEMKNGPTTALDILCKKVIKDTDYYKTGFSKEDVDTYHRNIEYVLAAFANDNLASSGYPSSLGKYNFLMLYFHTANINDIINNYYKLNATSAKLVNKYTSDTLLNFFKSYTMQAYNNYFSVGGSSLVIYIDMDEDGVADTIDLWNQEQIDASNKLFDLIINILSASSTDHSTTLTSIVEEYNSSSRFDNGASTPQGTFGEDDFEFDPTSPECTWAEYRKLGLYIKIEDLSAASNTNNTIDEIILKRIKEVYNSVDFKLNKTFQTEYIDIDGKGLELENGYTLLLLKDAVAPSSFTYTSDDDTYNIYNNITILFKDEVITIADLLSDGDDVSLNQIKLYLYEFLEEGTNELIPSSVSSALSSYLSPVISKYTDSTSQLIILMKYAKDVQSADFEFATTDGLARTEKLLTINNRVSNNYVDETSLTNNFANWKADLELILESGE